MTRLDNVVLMEICSQLAEWPAELQKFALAGKETFLAYVQVFQSVQECVIHAHSISIALANGTRIWREYNWKHLVYLCGRYTRALKFDFSFLMDETFCLGLRENRCLENVEAPEFKDVPLDMNIVNLIGTFPLRKLTGDIHFLKAMNDQGHQLILDTLTVVRVPHPGEVFLLKNFSASEIQLHSIWPARFVNQVVAARKQNKLNSNLVFVKKWFISLRSAGVFKFIFPMLNVLKMVSPNMEQCTFEMKRHSRTTKAKLQQYSIEIDEFVSAVSKLWNPGFESCPYIDLKFEVFVGSRLFHDVQDVEECFRNFPNYEIRELLPHYIKRRFVASKRTVFTNGFFLDVQIIINCF